MENNNEQSGNCIERATKQGNYQETGLVDIYEVAREK